MRGLKAIVAALFLLGAVSFAEAAEETKTPDTVFQKAADYSESGYKKDVEPIKKVSVFQIMADWVNGKPLKWEAKNRE